LPEAPELVHATCVAIGRTAALLRGRPGAGKSDLALRFLYLARRGPAALEAPILVADDQVALAVRSGRLVAAAPPTIRGKLEVRGVGIVEVKSLADADVGLIVDLVSARVVERLPEPDRACLLGIDVPRIELYPWDASAPIKLALALARSARA
jgi:HPr kinase/phosphorylase